MKQLIKAAIWVRVSPGKDDQSDSPEHHRLRAEAYAKAKGWQIVEIYTINISGRVSEKHPEFLRMVDDMKRGRFHMLIFSRVARLGRTVVGLSKLAEEFQEYGAGFVALDQEIDTSTPAGRMMYHLLATFAEYEREEISDRIAASVPVRAELGKSLGGVPAYGYEWVNGKLEIYEPEAEVRRLIFRLFWEKKRAYSVARELNDRGYRTRRGNEWTGPQVTRMIEETISKGLRRANWCKASETQKCPEVKPESEWVWVPCPALVSEEEWERCNQIIRDQRAGRAPLSKKTRYLFSGKVWCGTCQQKIYTNRIQNEELQKYHCKKCKVKIRTSTLETLLCWRIDEFVGPNQRKKRQQALAGQISETEKLFQRAREHAASLSRDINKLRQSFLKGNLPEEALGALVTDLLKQQPQAEAEVLRLEEELKELKAKQANANQALDEVQAVSVRWAEVSYQQKHDLIEQCVTKITVGPDWVDLDLELIRGTYRTHEITG